MQDETRILLEIKQELGQLSTDIKNVKDDVNDLKSLMVQVIRIEERQSEMEKNQLKLLDMKDELDQLKADGLKIKEDLNNLGNQLRKIENEIKELTDMKLNHRITYVEDYIKEKKQSAKEVRKNIFKLIFSLLEKVIIWIVITLFALKEWFSR